jgi:predicted ATPase
LTQEIAYGSLAEDTRRRYHERIAHALSSSFTHLIDAQPELLAYHLTSAGLGMQAVQQWHRAGQQARRRSAYTEAITHLTRGLDLVATLPADPEAFRQEIALQLSLGASLGALKGFGAPGVARAYTRARDLCQDIGDRVRLFGAMSGLESFVFLKGDLRGARDLGEQCLALAAELGEPSMLCRASNAMAGVLVHRGEHTSAREHLQRAISLVDKSSDPASSNQAYVTHPLVFALSFDSWALWLLGDPDRALCTSQEALAVAAPLGHPHSMAFAHYLASVLRHLRRDPGVIRAQAETAIAFSSEHGFPLYRALGVIMRGWGLAEQGDVADGLAEIRRGLADRLETGAGLGRPFILGLLAATHARAGQPETALKVLAEAIAVGRESTERVWEPELLRQNGELLAADPIRDIAEAERAFREAIALSRSQSTRSWELRAAMSLGRLLVRQDRRREARAMLVEVYQTFTEGFDTADLLDARALLEELAE